MKRTTLITGALIIMLTAVLVSSPSDGLAAHYTFLQENPSARGGLFNWTFVGWALTPYPTDWDDDGSYTQHIRNAISTWETAVPQLDFYEEPDDWNYLYFANGRCVIGVACLSVDETDWEGERGAHYLLWGTITMDIDGNNFTDLGKEDILRHEIGHWIGLDEAYNEGSSTSCSTIQSVMNATRHGTGENCVGVHAPTQRDISAVTRYWFGDGPEQVVLSERPNDVLRLTWKDAMWAESNNTVMLYYWDNDNARFVRAAERQHISKTGFHKDAIDRTLGREWDLRAEGWPTDT